MLELGGWNRRARRGLGVGSGRVRAEIVGFDARNRLRFGDTSG
jgi:hypothetical protein